jgi:hypothetical protein
LGGCQVLLRVAKVPYSREWMSERGTGLLQHYGMG